MPGTLKAGGAEQVWGRWTGEGEGGMGGGMGHAGTQPAQLI